MSNHRIKHPRGLLDTSVVIDLAHLSVEQLPDECCISVITFAELAAGPHATNDVTERADRQDQLQRISATLSSLEFTDECALAYGRIYAATIRAGRSVRPRLADLLIASTAAAQHIPLYTRNPEDVAGLEELVEIVAV